MDKQNPQEQQDEKKVDEVPLPSMEQDEETKKEEEFKVFKDFLHALSPEEEYSKMEYQKKFEQLTREKLFWDPQPVPKFTDFENQDIKGGEIDKNHDLERIKKEPYPMLDNFEWFNVDVQDAKQLDDLYNFLYENYVEDDDNMFRFDYSKEFLLWALTPPGYLQEWHVGVRVKKNKKMVGFISGIPVTTHANEGVWKGTEINFLCVYKKLRSHRLAPVLIKEITRRVNVTNQWQAVYTAGVLLPTPITQSRYHHRSLNPKKLIDIKFSSLAPNQTMARMVKLYRLPEDTQLVGLREMKSKDIPQVTKLLQEYLKKFKVYLKYTQDDVKHWFLPRKDVIYTYVVENDNKVTDLISFYCLPSSVLKHEKHKVLRAAYAYYNIANTVSMLELMSDALVLANSEGFDVFNALNIMDNGSVFKDLKFNTGDGCLHYYFYNWRMNKPLAPNEVGITLL